MKQKAPTWGFCEFEPNTDFQLPLYPNYIPSNQFVKLNFKNILKVADGGVCIITFGLISSKIPDFYPYIRKPFTPTFTPTYEYAQNEGVRGADCPVSLGLFEPPTRKPEVLLHSVLPLH